VNKPDQPAGPMLRNVAEVNMSDLLKTRHQLAKMREMRSELRRLDAVLAQAESALVRDVAQLERGAYPKDAQSFTLFDGPATGWLYSLVESYIAIAYAMDAGTGRRLVAFLGTFAGKIRAREEQIVTRDSAAFWKKQNL
jgi:hypothetical protein